MTQDEIIEITRQLRICELTSKPKQSIHYSLTIHEMQEVAKLVAAKAIAELESQKPVGQLLEDAFGRGQVMWFNKPKDESMLYTQLPQFTEQNFCSRCGKRTTDLTTIHTCTPPQENT